MPSETQIVSDAAHLAELGLPLHWLKPPSEGGKEPVVYAWHRLPWQTPRRLHATYRPGYNLGVRTGLVDGARACVVVLDLDSPLELAWARESMPWTPLRVVTRRGEHWYYLQPGPGVVVPTRHKPGGRAIDVSASLAQVVCPPSVHASGHAYSWVVKPDKALLQQTPTWDPTWFRRVAPAVTAPTMGSQAGGSDVRALRRGRGFARNWRVAPESEGRGTQTYLLAVTLVQGLRLDPETAYRLLASEWNPRLSEPYTEDLLRRKVAEAQKAQYATHRL